MVWGFVKNNYSFLNNSFDNLIEATPRLAAKLGLTILDTKDNTTEYIKTAPRKLASAGKENINEFGFTLEQTIFSFHLSARP